MDPSFWHERWADNKIGFHEPEPNSLLVEYLPQLDVEQGVRVFIPLCGKTLDIGWLLSQGYQVVGAELSELAVSQLFSELDVLPNVQQWGEHKHYSAPGLDIFVGDIFQLEAAQVGVVDLVYDRAALVAMPETMRAKYTEQLRCLTQNAPQLLISYEYDQSLMQGPPFSLTDAEVERHYGVTYRLNKLASFAVENTRLEQAQSQEKVWALVPR